MLKVTHVIVSIDKKPHVKVKKLHVQNIEFCCWKRAMLYVLELQQLFLKVPVIILEDQHVGVVSANHGERAMADGSRIPFERAQSDFHVSPRSSWYHFLTSAACE